MDISISINSFIALFSAMIVLAAVPDQSAFAVIARTMSAGITHGFAVTAGIITADFVFIALAILGLAAIAETSEALFNFVKYICAAYLIWLGIKLWRPSLKNNTTATTDISSRLSSFLCGLLITFSDPKAILFYMSFLPAFIDLTQASIADTGIIMFAAALSIGAAKLGYAFMANKANQFLQNQSANNIIHITAGCIMIGAALLLLIKN